MRYLLVSSACIAVLYIIYRLIYKTEYNFHQLRVYLLFSILLSVLLPVNNFKIDMKIPTYHKSVQVKRTENDLVNLSSLNNNRENSLIAGNASLKSTDWLLIVKRVYLLITALFFIKLSGQIFILIFKFLKSEKKQIDQFTLIINHDFKSSFSFFKWIFINNSNKSDDEIQKIIAHEIIHAKQFHSIDLILIEILAAIMWFNPFIWMLRNSIQLVHEYLADDGVLKQGFNKMNYQKLLVNEIAEERLLNIFSSFNKSLIKKRMIMMNKNESFRNTSSKILILIPLSILLFFGISCVNGQEQATTETVTAVALLKMNVLYLGLDNPVDIAVSGVKSSDINAEIADDDGFTNGVILGENGNYIIRPRRLGKLKILVKVGDEVVQENVFRVKAIPDPVATVNRQKGGEISLDILLKQTEVVAYMENFDFDLNYVVKSFTVTMVTDNGYTLESESNSYLITEEQKEIFKMAKVGSKIIFENILAVGPDGAIRNLPSLVFEIGE